MNPDLKKYHATRLEIEVELGIPPSVAAELKKYSPPDEDGDSLFTSKYPRHRIWLWMLSQKERPQDDRIWYFMRYFSMLGRQERKKSSNIEGLFDILTTVVSDINLHATTDFLFTKDLKASPIIEIPNKYINGINLPFDFIQGYHFTKATTESGKRYDIVLDSEKRGEYFLRVTFERSEQLNKELFIDCIKEAESLARKFVIF